MSDEYKHPKWVTVDWLNQQTKIDWVDSDEDGWSARQSSPGKWTVWRDDEYGAGGPFYENTQYVHDMMHRYGINSLTVSCEPNEVTITQSQLQEAIAEAIGSLYDYAGDSVNPGAMADKLWAVFVPRQTKEAE